MTQVYMLIGSIKENRAGIANAMYYRSTHFYNEGIRADIVTLDYNPNYATIIKNIKAANKMDSRTQMLNLFTFFDDESLKYLNPTDSSYKLANRLAALETFKKTQKKEGTFKYISPSDNNIWHIVKYNADNNVNYVDTFQEGERKERAIYRQGKIKCVRSFRTDGSKKSETIFNSEEEPYLERIFDEEEKPTTHMLLGVHKEFSTFDNLCIHFLEQLIEDKSSNVLLCDGPKVFPKILQTNHTKIKKYAYIHTNHFRQPYCPGAKIKAALLYIFKHADALDGIIVMTEKQKQHIVDEFHLKNVYVIPNFLVVDKKRISHRKTNDIVIFSRIVKMKGIQNAIKAFAIVCEKNPAARLIIYGKGDYEAELRTLISEKNLSNNVFMMGYANDIKEVLKNKIASLSTSEYEAFGLSIAESISYGVPVISFDINYGPSDIISDGETGFLIESGNVEALANKILYALDHKKEMRKMGKRAQQALSEQFPPERLLRLWKDLFTTA